MLDPVTLTRLAKLRQQEFLDQAAEYRRPGVRLVPWSRLLEPIYAFLQRRSRRSAAYQPLTTLGQTTLEECTSE